MLLRLSFSFYDLRDSLWYRPAIMTLGAVLLALIMLRIDEHILAEADIRTWWIFGGGAEGARGVLSAIAGTMMTVVTTAFSITMVTLQLGSSQYSPRILRNFTGDRGNQLVLGVFIATFVYCLLVLRAVRSGLEDRETFVPGLSITVAMLLALLCIGSLIYFFHHASRTIQASVILDSTAHDTFALIERHLDTGNSEPMSARADALRKRLPTVLEVHAEQPGYLRGVDDSRLIELAQQQDLLLTMHPRIGDHLFTGSPLLTVQRFTIPGQEVSEDEDDDSLLEQGRGTLFDLATRVSDDDEDAGEERTHLEHLDDALRRPFTVGLERTLNEDVLFGFQQLADIGLRALSPGVNDPTTAMFAIDQLGEGLVRVQETTERDRVAVDDEGTPRVIYPEFPFDVFLTISFKHLRVYGASDPFVCAHLATVLGTVHRLGKSDRARRAIAAEARAIVDAFAANEPLPTDMHHVREAASWAFTIEDDTLPV